MQYPALSTKTVRPIAAAPSSGSGDAVARIRPGTVGIASVASVAAEAPSGGIEVSGIRRDGGSAGVADSRNLKLGRMVLR